MKYLLVILLILVVFWLWQYERRTQKGATTPPRPPASPDPAQTGGATEIVACSVCQLHLPRTEALIGRGARPYCSDAHRRQAEG